MFKTRPGARPEQPGEPPRRPERRAGPAPDRASLHDAALRHLSRYAATESGLVRVLDRRIARWLRDGGADDQAAQCRAAAREVARALVASGMIDDAAFAAARTRRLLRTGRSRRAVAAHLAAKGVGPDLAGGALPGPDDEMLAAIAFVRRRRFGPFRHPPAEDLEPDAAQQTALRELGALARAGFPREVAERALGLERDDAERLLLAFKQG